MNEGVSISDHFRRHSKAIDASLEMDDALVSLCRTLTEIVPPDHAGVVLFDEGARGGLFCAEFPSKGAVGRTVMPSVELLNHLMKATKPLVIDTIHADDKDESLNTLLIELGICTALLVPICERDAFRGFLAIGAVDAKHSFSQSEIAACESIAKYAGAVIQTSRLFDEVRVKAEQLETLRRVSLAITSTLVCDNLGGFDKAPTSAKGRQLRNHNSADLTKRD